MIRNNQKLHSIFLLMILFIFTASSLNAQQVEKHDKSHQLWTKNCLLRHNYKNKLIFTVTQNENGVSWSANNRKAFIKVFEGLVFDDAPSAKLRKDRIMKLISNAPGGDHVVISSKLSSEIEALWKEVQAKAESIGVKCK